MPTGEAVPSTLAQVLRPAAVDFSVLERRYGAQLELVRRLIGVVPNCDPYLEVWPPAFRSYNVMVPNLLNLPALLWGVGAPKQAVGQAMYASSRAAGCMYCSAHTCSFALRRGVPGRKIADPGGGDLTELERAAVAVANGASTVPASLTSDDRDALFRLAGPGDGEWIVLSVAMMGFLNKMMDALEVELEDATVREVGALIEPTGWSTGRHPVARAERPTPSADGDSLGLKLGVLRFLPSALALDRRWTKGVPGRWPAAGDYLRERTGHDFPVLRQLSHSRAVRAIATMIRDNCTASESAVGLDAKHRAGVVYATIAEDPGLMKASHELARGTGADEDFDSVARFAAEPTDFDDPEATERARRSYGAATVLAKAASYSPARMTPSVVEVARDLQGPEAVEIVTWVSVLQLLHRLAVVYPDGR